MGKVYCAVERWFVVTVRRVNHTFVEILPRVMFLLGSNLFCNKLGLDKKLGPRIRNFYALQYI